MGVQKIFEKYDANTRKLLSRLFVIYEAWHDIEHYNMLDEEWHLEYDEKAIAVYAVRNDGVKTRLVYEPASDKLVQALLEAVDDVEKSS